MIVWLLCLTSIGVVLIVIWGIGKASDLHNVHIGAGVLCRMLQVFRKALKVFRNVIKVLRRPVNIKNVETGCMGSSIFTRIAAEISIILRKFQNIESCKGHSNKGSNLMVYGVYCMTAGEKARYFSTAFIVLFAAGYLFFNSLLISLAVGGLALLYPSVKKKELARKRKRLLNMQFKDALYSISSSLSAGRSVEGAFKAALDDLKILYPDRDAFIIKELEQVNRKVDMNDTLEHALSDFAYRSEIDDIKNFADVFIICKNTGGNLVEVIRNTYSILNQKIEIKNEIDVLIAEQKLSQKILNIMPFGLLAVIITGSPDYVKPLYSPGGHAAMVVVLVLLVVAYLIGSKITDIKI